MNAMNQNKYFYWSNSIRVAIQQRRIPIAIAVVGCAIFGVAVATSQATRFGVKKSEVLISVDTGPQSTLPSERAHNELLALDPKLQASTPTTSQDGEQDVISEFVLDAIEFAVVGVEVSHQFGSFRQIGSTVSWLAQELAQHEDAQLIASTPSNETLAPYPLLSTTEREMATWLVQNTLWNR